MRFKNSLIISLILSSTTFIYAGGFQINLQGHKSIGMGGAFTSVCSDASAVFYNPAGITTLIGHNIMTGVSMIIPNISLQTSSFSNIDQISKISTPIQLYYTKQLNHKFTAGISINNQFGASSAFDDDWQGKYIVQSIGLTTTMIQPTMAWRIDDRLSLGGGLVYTLGNFNYDKAIPVNTSSSAYGKASLSGSGSAFGYNIGAYYIVFNSENPMLESNISLGFSYRSSISLSIDNGQAMFSDIPSSLASTFPPVSDFSSSITLPAAFNSGMYIKMLNSDNKSFGLVFEIGKTFWSSYDTLMFDFNNEETPDVIQVKNWKDAFVYRFGIEYSYFERYYIRAGMYLDHSPIPTGYVSPELPDNDHIGYTLGFGYSINEELQIDLSYLTSSILMRGSLDAAGFEATYNRKVRVLGVGISYRFDKCNLFKNKNKAAKTE